MFEFIKKLFGKKINSYKLTNFLSLDTRTSLFISTEDVTDNREETEPIKIIHLLESSEKINDSDIEEKLKFINDRIKFYQDTANTVVPFELLQVRDMLIARRKYKKHYNNFAWKTTSREKIQELLQKYKLSHRGLDQFIYNLPVKAVKECEKFSKVLKKTTKNKPEFSIVAPEKYFKKQNTDPILLAKSPFGDFYYILCAWDEEVDIVRELLYGEKIEI